MEKKYVIVVYEPQLQVYGPFSEETVKLVEPTFKQLTEAYEGIPDYDICELKLFAF